MSRERVSLSESDRLWWPFEVDDSIKWSSCLQWKERPPMSRYDTVALCIVAFGLWALAWPAPLRADKEETCASRYPNAPKAAPNGYVYKNESDAYMAFRREALKVGYKGIKKTTRADAEFGPCVGHGEHINLHGTKGGKWRAVGSMTSCKICEDTPRGPRLRNSVWRIHKKF